MLRTFSTISLAFILAAAIPGGATSQPASPSLVPAEPGPGAPADGRQHFTIASAVLGETRRVFVSVPPSFDRSPATRRYPLLVVTDGEAPSATAAVTASRELSRTGLAPELVIVGVENAGGYEKRVYDLTPPGLSVSGSDREQGGDRFLDFLEGELLPAVDARFRTAAPRVLMGHSSGGVLATWAAATRDTWRFTIALDTPVHLDEDWLAERLIDRARRGGQPVRYASYNAQFGWPDRAWTALVAAAPESWVLRNERWKEETHVSMPMLGAYLGLRELFLDYSRKAAPVYPTTSILPYYASLSEPYGGAVVPPEPLMRDVVTDLALEGRGREAQAAFDQLLRAYGEAPNAADLRASIEEALTLPPPDESVESLLATPMPATGDVASLVGEWAGETRREHQVGRFTLVIEDDAGRAKGRVTWHFGDQQLVQTLQYLTVQPDGFTYGYMNGMRPRGMLLYVMTRDGDGYRGTMKWGGVRPPQMRPGGPPPEYISLRRVR